MIRWAGLALVAVAGVAAAQTAYFDARSAGQVGERYDGYLGYSAANGKHYVEYAKWYIEEDKK